jgi:hypothetical protein
MRGKHSGKERSRRGYTRKKTLIEVLILLLVIPILVMYFSGVNTNTIIISLISLNVFDLLLLDALVAKPGFAEGPQI